MNKNKVKKLLRSEDKELVNLGIVAGMEFSAREKMIIIKYLANKTLPFTYPEEFVLYDEEGKKDPNSSNIIPTFSISSITAIKQYIDDFLSYKIVKDGAKKFDRKANRVRNNRKSRTGINASGVS